MSNNKITPDFIKKAHWYYEYFMRKDTNERIRLLLEYCGYSMTDLALLLDVEEADVECYLVDFTKMPLQKMWLLGRVCNVAIDCFPDMWLWHNRMVDQLNLPETDAKL
ncbi:MAG: hypothetical protein NC218_06970 [Acetobacter sp.]|nr:hypothetical protein [Acetobacter sp.]